MAIKRKRTHTAVTVDRETYAQITRIAEVFSEKLKRPISRTDVVRMGITAILSATKIRLKEPPNE